MKPAPRSGSMATMRAIFSAASPSSSVSPIFNCSASSSDASTHTVPGSGAPALSRSGASGVLRSFKRPRSG